MDVSSHFLQTLEKYEIKQSGLYCHLSYRSAYLSKIVYKEHDYAKEILSYDENIPVFTAETGDIWHSALVPSDADRASQEIRRMIQFLQTQSVMKISLVLKKPKHC